MENLEVVNMQWKVNSRETIYDLKNNELRITIVCFLKEARL